MRWAFATGTIDEVLRGRPAEQLSRHRDRKTLGMSGSARPQVLRPACRCTASGRPSWSEWTEGESMCRICARRQFLSAAFACAASAVARSGCWGASGVEQIGVGRSTRQVVGHEGADGRDCALAGADLVEHSPYHGAGHALVLMTPLDFGVPERVPVRPQTGVVEPSDQIATAVELEAAFARCCRSAPRPPTPVLRCSSTQPFTL